MGPGEGFYVIREYFKEDRGILVPSIMFSENTVEAGMFLELASEWKA